MKTRNILVLLILLLPLVIQADAFSRPVKPKTPWMVHLSGDQDRPLSEVLEGKVSFAKLEQTNLDPDYRGQLWYRIIVPGETLDGIPNLAVSLGRIADCDRTYWNGTLVGQLGFDRPGGRLMPRLNRVYPIRDVRQTNELLIEVRKLQASILGIGLRDEAPIFGDHEVLQREATFLDFIRSRFPLVMGFALVLFGLYFLMLFNFLRQRRDFLFFGGSLLGFGGFAICYSFWPYEVFSADKLVMTIHVLSCFWGLVSMAHWYLKTPTRTSPWVKRGLLYVTVPLSVIVLVLPEFDQVLAVFLAWHWVLIPTLVYFLVYNVRDVRRNQASQLLPAMAISIFLSALVYDVLVTRHWIEGEQWSIPTVLFLLGASVAFLGRDFAHAYLNVERTVESRTKDLREANESLRALEKMKARLFANISHDFKTPIAIAFSNLQEVKRRAGEMAGSALQGAERALHRLQTMVVDLLDTVRAEAGELKLVWQTAAIGPLVRSWAEPYEVLCRSRNLDLLVDIEMSDTLKIPVDVDKLERVFANLMGNALKFTQEGHVAVRLRCDAAHLYLEVEDTGPGIPQEEHEQVFDRYFQASNTSLQLHGGSGIGLSFVKEVVMALNGRVWVETNSHGGSTFSISLPLAQDVDVTGEHEVVDTVGRVASMKGSLDVPYPETAPTILDPDRASLLIAEDNPEVAQIVADVLRPEFNVYFARHGKDALKQLETISVDCVISDVMMPEMSGTEFLQELRQHSKWKILPVIMLTSKAETEDIVKHLTLGAQDYVAKPFQREILLARVKAQIETVRLREQLVGADKMASLGMLTAGISHEIRNPVHAAQNYVGALTKLAATVRQLAQQNAQGEADDKLGNKLDRMVRAIEGTEHSLDRIHTIVESMRGYATGSMERVEIKLEEAIHHALAIVETKRKTKNVNIIYSPTSRTVLLGYVSINQVLVNLLDNALDAVPEEDGQVLIEVSPIGTQVTLAITDNGPGISAEDRTRIFEPFMTTKPPELGTGLGLYVSKDIVEAQHGGRLEIESTPGEGATFRLRLPLEAPKPMVQSEVLFHGKKLSVG